MHDDFSPLPGPCSQLRFLQVTQSDTLVHLRLHRPDKRNAISDAFLAELQIAFSALPAHCRAVVLSGAGEHFCAGLDLSEVMERSVADGVLHSRAWHQAFEQIQYGRVPVIAALHGAVIGGGLELAATAHLRVADRSTFYGLPEGQAAGLSNYLVAPGAAVEKAIELARKVASNAPLSNFAILQALPRIADMSRSDGLFVEALMSAVAQGDDEAKARVRAFLEKRAGKVGRDA